MAGRARALLVATDTYSDPTFQQMLPPRADADALAALLADETVGGYEVLPVLHNAGAHEVALAIHNILAEAHRDDLVLLYVSGHGVKDVSGELYLPTTNSRHNRLAESAVSSLWIRHQMDASQSRGIVVWLDCCYAGAFPYGTLHRATQDIDIPARLGGPGCAVMTSSSTLEYAYEATERAANTVMGGASPSVFTRVLIEGLRTGAADLDGDGVIDVEELYDYVYPRVRAATPQQTPTLDSRIDGKLYVATGTRRTDLPPAITAALNSQQPSVRLAMVADVSALTTSTDRITADAARYHLTCLTEDDDPSVAQAARAALRPVDQFTASPDPAMVIAPPLATPARPEHEKPAEPARTRRRRATAGAGMGERLEHAARQLATAVRDQWTAEAERQSLLRPEPPRVRWSTTSRPVAAPPSSVVGGAVPGWPLRMRLHGDLPEVVGKFRQLPSRQLVVLGAPGVGKTVLAMMLTLGLLKDLQPGEPVPVLLPVSSWNPREEHLDAWIALMLAERYPGLSDARAYGAAAATRLVAEARVMPVLDGLDELPDALLPAAMDALNQAVADRRPLVVTCRSVEYEAAVTEGGSPLSQAAVVELEPATVVDAIAYLGAATDSDSRWLPVFDHLRVHSDGALAQALSTPLMVDLARVAYSDPATDPTDLLDTDRFADHTTIEDHLLDSFLPASYSPNPPAAPPVKTPRYQPQQAQRWLTFLGDHLHRTNTRELAWWHLPRAVPQSLIAVLVATTTTILGTILGLLLELVITSDYTSLTAAILGAVAGLSVGVVVGAHAGRGAHADRRPPARTAAMATMAAMGGALGDIATAVAIFFGGCAVLLLAAYAVAKPAAAQASLAIVNWVDGLRSADSTQLRVTLVVVSATLGITFIKAFGVGHTTVSQRGMLRMRRLVPSLAIGLAIGLVLALPWLVLGVITSDDPAGFFLIGSMFAVLIATPAGTRRWLAIPVGQRGASSPGSVLRGDRSVLLLTMVASGVVAALAIAFIGWLTAAGISYLVVVGVLMAAVIAVVVLFGSGTAWSSYTVARLWLAMRGRLPWRLMRFLRTAQHKKVLRQAGPTYQFRHELLRTQLTEPRPLTRQPGAALPLIEPSPHHDQRRHARNRTPWHAGWRGLVMLTAASALLAGTTAFIYLRESPPTAVHTGSTVNAMAFSRDGNTLATADFDTTVLDKTVRLWDVRTGEPLRRPLIHTGYSIITAMAFSRDGNTLATATELGTVRMWDVRTGQPMQTPAIHAGHSSVAAMAFSLDGNTVTTANNQGITWLWDVRTGQSLQRVIRADDATIEAVAFSSDASTLATANKDGMAQLWDVRTGQSRPTPPINAGHRSGGVAFSRDGNTLATTSDNTVRLWDARTGQPRPTPPINAGYGSGAVAFSLDGSTLATADFDGTVRLWRLPKP